MSDFFHYPTGFEEQYTEAILTKIPIVAAEKIVNTPST